MKDDLIKRSDAIKDLCDISNNSDMPNDWHRGMSVAISALYRVPSADRPQGEWIWKERHINRNYIVKGTDSMGEPAEVYVHEDRIEKRNYCSECGKLGDDIWLNYCPHCGAYMRKGADDDR